MHYALPAPKSIEDGLRDCGYMVVVLEILKKSFTRSSFA